VEELRQALGKATGKAVKVNIFEIRYPELDANLIAENVAQQLERRVSFRKVLKQTVSRSMKAGAKGVRVAVAGRLGGAEMSRREWEREGRVPLHTLRADIEFGRAIAKNHVRDHRRQGLGLSRRHRARAAPGLAERSGGGRAGRRPWALRPSAGRHRSARRRRSRHRWQRPPRRARWEPPRCCNRSG